MAAVPAVAVVVVAAEREAVSRTIIADRHGNRANPAGSSPCGIFARPCIGGASLDEAIHWAAGRMGKDGPLESLLLLSPIGGDLPMPGLGKSVGTPPKIRSKSHSRVQILRTGSPARNKNRRKIVLFHVPYVSYGITVAFLGHGASRAAELGARAALVHSVGSAILRTPHTGALNYAEDVPKILSAAVTIEDAMLIQRLTDSGDKVRLRLRMEAQSTGPVDSANVIGEIRDIERPEEVVVIGGHLDSWDFVQGSHDDASGAAMRADCIHGGRSGVVLWPMKRKGPPVAALTVMAFVLADMPDRLIPLDVR